MNRLTPEEAAVAVAVAVAAAARITREQVAEALEAQVWTYARTMPTMPHEWCLKRN